MNSRHSAEGKKSGILEILSTFCLFTGFWGSAVLGQYQMYARLRFSLPTFSIIDYFLLGLGFVLGIIGARIWKNKNTTRFLIGFAGSALTAYIAYLILPVMPFANQAIPPLHLGIIEITPISPILGLLSIFGILCTGSMFKRRTDTTGKDAVWHNITKGLSLAFSAGLGLLVISARPDSHGGLIYLSMSGLIGIVGLWVGFLPSRLTGNIPPADEIATQKKDRTKKRFEFIHTTVTWLFSSIGLVILMHLVNVSMSDPRETVIFKYFYVCVVIGTGLMLLLAILESRSNSSRIRRIVLALLGFGSTLLIHWSIKQGLHTHWFFRYICYGVGIVCFLTVEIEQFSRSKHPVIFASAFILALGMTGYTSFIPAKIPSLMDGTSSLLMDIGLYVTVTLLLLMEVGNLSIYIVGKKEN